MRRSWWLMLVLCGALAALAADAPGDGLERNRRLLTRWRADPEHYQRLQRDLRAFHALPPEQQERLRRLDRQLHEGDPATQARRWAVLVRYSAWLERLPDADRVRVLAAADGPARVRVIREIRDREWVAALPAKLRDEVLALPPEKRPARIAELREEERRQRRLWQKGTGSRDGPNLRPSRLSEFTPQAIVFIEELKRRLNPEERARLDQAEGKWPDLPRVVRELAEAHPSLPPLPTGPITRWAELPAETRKVLTAALPKRRVKLLQGYTASVNRWPDYALEVGRLMQRERLIGPPLGASRPTEFPEEVRRFLEVRLFPALLPGQKEMLARQEGRWPEYPQMLARLARDRNLLIPGMTLPPGPAEVWENVRLVFADAPGEAGPRERSGEGRLRPEEPIRNGAR